MSTARRSAGTPAAGASFAARLLAWYDRARRTLPWRDCGDPWLTWVSEIMLQQTRVEVVLDAFPRFAERFPDPASLAAASDDELHAAWRGLGYYRRARLLRDGARQVVDRHAGRVPADPAALGALAGIGDYTRAAIASIAFGVALPAIDGNVERVLARHALLEDDVKTAVGRRRLRELASARLAADRPGDFNQALMDLGATVCTPRRPRCADCPVAADCAARAAGRQQELPKLPPRRAAVPVTARAVLVRDRQGRVLAARIPAGEVNEGQLELPTPGVLVHQPRTGTELDRALLARYGARLAVGAERARVQHGITHHRITLVVHDGELLGARGPLLAFHAADDPTAPWSTPARKALHAVAR
ncbi:MAG: A/G-specific adenine glycosylase [Planctomycetes bacterium]|nr:A/G-specific adenine glycosylase [Planctomycetota bacterium]